MESYVNVSLSSFSQNLQGGLVILRVCLNTLCYSHSGPLKVNERIVIPLFFSNSFVCIQVSLPPFSLFFL